MEPGARGFLALSLDGFIAREDGSIDWLERANALLPPGEDCGYAEFFAAADALVLGRATFETVLGFGAWPYGGKPTTVLSSRPLEIPSELRATVETSSETPAALVERLAERGLRRLYVDGGETLRRFLAAGLLRELTLTTVPVAIGRGRPLFEPGDRRFELLACRHWPCGFVQVRWRIPDGG